MPTRAAAKQEAALLRKTLASSLSFPPATPVNAADIATAVADSTTATTKRKRAPVKKKTSKPVVNNMEVLPHGMGMKGDLLEDEGIDENPAALPPPPTKKRARRGKLVTPESSGVNEVVDPVVSELLESKRGRRKSETVKTEIWDDITVQDIGEVKPKRERAPKKKKTLDTSKEVVTKAEDLVAGSGTPKKLKKHPYGLTPGRSPFPTHVEPTPEACEEATRLLLDHHAKTPEERAKFQPPEKIPPPSMDVAGCGEVPDLLDAILRTLLSAATSSNNSNLALKGLKKRFGVRKSTDGNAWINWDVVRLAEVSDIEEAIKSGGLAAMKSKNIKKILDAVYKQNCARRDALVKEKETGDPATIPGAKDETQEAKETEIERADENFLSMDYVFEMSTNEAMEEMTKLPGIGVKTASCVILFCMKRPSFAVDTHVWRHCKMLGWVPKGASRDKTFSHCEVRVPDHLKYPLHQLFLRHGKTCGRCKAKGSTEEWDNAECPIEHLVTRPERKREASKAVRKRKWEEDEDESEEEMIIDDEE